MKQKLLSTRNVALALLSALLALCLAFGIFILPKKANAAEDGQEETVTAFHSSADCDSTATNVAKIGEVEYDDLATAINAAQDGETVEILKCVKITKQITIQATDGRKITLDFYGHTVSGYIIDDAKCIFRIGAVMTNTGASVHFKNGTIINANSTIAGTSNSTLGVLAYGGTNAEFTNMHIEAGFNAFWYGSGRDAKNLIVNSGVYISLRTKAIGRGGALSEGSNKITFTGKGTTEFYSYTCTYNELPFKYLGDYTDKTTVPAIEMSCDEWEKNWFAGSTFTEGYTFKIETVSASQSGSAVDKALKFSVIKAPKSYFTGNNGTDYPTLEEAINEGCISAKLLDNVPASVTDEYGKTNDLEFTVPAGKSITLELNHLTFSGKIINNGNLIITGENSNWDNHVFNGTIENVGEGTTVTNEYCVFKGDALKLFEADSTTGRATVTLGKTAAISETVLGNDPNTDEDDETVYRIMKANVRVNGINYMSYNDAIKSGERDIDLKESYDLAVDNTINDSLYLDIGYGNTITINLGGYNLEGGSSLNDASAINIESGTVIVKNGTITAMFDNVPPKAMTFCIENRGNLILENVTLRGGNDKEHGSFTSCGALLRNYGGTVSLTNCMFNNTLGAQKEPVLNWEGEYVIDPETGEASYTPYIEGRGIETTGGSVKLDNVTVFGYIAVGVYATGGSVEIGGGTTLNTQSTAGTVNAGALWIDGDVDVTIGVADLYINQNTDMNSIKLDGVHAKAQSNTTTVTDAFTNEKATLRKYRFIAHDYDVTFDWADDFSSCVANYVCKTEENCSTNQTAYATVSYEITAGDCTTGGTVTYTATVTFDGEQYTDTQVVTIEAGRHTYALSVGHSPDNIRYNAFDKFDTRGLVIYKSCIICKDSSTRSVVTNYEVKYLNNANCLHCGDDRVIVTADRLSCNVIGLVVDKVNNEVKWQCNEKGVSEWADIDGAFEHIYNGNTFKFRAIFGVEADQEYIIEATETAVQEGSYTISFDTSVYTDYNLSNSVLNAVIKPEVININTGDMLTWHVGENKYLQPGMLYLYTTDANNAYPSMIVRNDAGWTFEGARNVLASVARYTNKDITVSVSTATGVNYNVALDNNSELTARGVGVYNAIAVLTAQTNYCFQSSILSDDAYGVVINISDDGKTATISKTWYIVEINNEVLLDTATSEDAVYVINGWTYGDTNINIPVPKLMHGDEGENWQTNSNVTLTLTKEGGTAVAVTRSNMSGVLNGTLPVGNYTLRVNVQSFTLGAHSNWWNDDNTDEATYPSFYREYVFTVEKAAIGLDITPDDETGYGDFEWKLTSTNKSLFFKEFIDLVKDNVEFKNNANNTLWYEMQFNFSRMNNNVYYNASRNELTDLIAGGRQGTYTVYFSIEAANHVTLGGAQDINRLKYFFTVTVYEEIVDTSITVSDVEYTGARVVPDVTPPDSVTGDVYEVIWDVNDKYINGGEHKVTISLYDTAHYRWVDADGKAITGAKTERTFSILKATSNNNNWVQDPSIISWEYGNFSGNKNIFTAVPRFLDEGESVHFAIKDSKGETVKGLEDMTAVNGVILEKFHGLLNNLPAGSYSLTVTVKATDNYQEKTANVTFAVSKGTNTWAITPNVMQWRYNSYNKAINLILGEAKIVDAGNPVKFKVTSDAEGETVLIDSFSLEEGVAPATVATKLGELTVGTYYLWSYVKETDSYSELQPDEPFEFAVSAAINDWTTAPNVIGWSYGGYNKETNLILGAAINGTVTFSVAAKGGSTVKGLESFTSVNGAIAGILAGLSAGEYTVTATVEVDSNYQEVNAGTATLTVAKAVNAWAETPSIITWIKGQYNAEENVITVSDIFNSVVDIVISRADNEENIIYQVDGGEVIIDNLATAEIGHYILKAVVNDTANYGGLEKTFSFRIFAPEGLAWWAWLLIIVGILGVIAITFWILHEKGILQMLTGKFVIAMRTKMTVDATIAAVRANMVAENSKKTRAAAERKDRLEALRKSREEGDTRSPEEQAAALEEQARVAAEKAEKMQKRAHRIQKRAEKARDKAESTAQAEATTAEEVTPGNEGETPDEN